MLSARSGPLGLGDLLDGAFRIYRANFVRLTLLAALFYVPLGLLSTLLLGGAVGNYADLLGVAANEPFYGDSSAAAAGAALFFFGAVLAISLLTMVCSVLAYLSLVAQTLALTNGGELSMGQSIRAGLRHFWRFLGMALIAGVMFGVVATAAYMAMIFVFFMFAVVAGLAIAPVSDNEIVMVGFTGLMILVVLALTAILALPLLTLAARWLAAPVALVAEEQGPLAALGRSWRLTERQTWRSILYVVLLGVLNFVALGLPVALLQWLLLIALTPAMFDAMSGLVAGLSFLLNILWLPFMAIALTLHYFDLRVRRESYDLELQVAALEAELRPATLP